MQTLQREEEKRKKEEERQRKEDSRLRLQPLSGAPRPLEDLCLNAIFIVAQFGYDTKIEEKKCVYASDIKNVATLCHATWDEEMLWAGLVRAQTGKIGRAHV